MKKIIRVLTFALCLCLMLAALSSLVTPLYRDMATDTFSGTMVTGDLESAEKYPDVLFLGSSHVYTQCSPAVMYSENGIASYLLTSSGQQLETSLALLQDQLSRHQPKVVVMDLFTAFGENRKAEDAGHAMLAAGAIASPLRRAQYMIGEFGLVEGVQSLFRLYNYHTELLQLEYVNWNHHKAPSKGAEPLWRVQPAEQPPQRELEPVQLEPAVQEIMRQMMELCRKKDVELVFTMLPMIGLPEIKNHTAAAREYIEAQGGCFLDCDTPAIYEEMGLDFSADFADDHHMNVSGQTKVSVWLANYLQQQYQLPDRRGEAGYESWDASAAWWAHHQLKHDLEQTETTYQALSCLAQADRENLLILMTVHPDAADPDEVNGGVRDSLFAMGMPPETLYDGGIFVLNRGQTICSMSGAPASWCGNVENIPLLAECGSDSRIQAGTEEISHIADMAIIVYDLPDHRTIYSELLYLK